MVDREKIKKAIAEKNFLSATDFRELGEKLSGKVRDVYDRGDSLVFIATDRQSAFDRSVALVPFKGQVLTQASCFWFSKTKDIVPNHFLESPDPSVIVGKKLDIFPIEFVVRGYLTGSTETSIWTAYARGERKYCGHELPNGLKKNQKLTKSLVTPTTKGEVDEKISSDEILARDIMSLEHWKKCEELSLKLFERGQQLAAKQGLILVDTKYEFGLDANGEITLADEIHTPDSSRFWLAKSYEEHFVHGREPESIDKEFLRRWLKEQCDPYKVEKLPEVPADLLEELAARYITLYEKITGENFSYREGKIETELAENLKKAKLLPS